MDKTVVLLHKTLGELYPYDSILHTEMNTNFLVYGTEDGKFLAFPEGFDIATLDCTTDVIPNLDFNYDGESNFQHYKGGKYLYVGDVYDIVNKVALVEYARTQVELNGTKTDFFLRPKAMFFENVTVDGVEVPRFRQI